MNVLKMTFWDGQPSDISFTDAFTKRHIPLLDAEQGGFLVPTDLAPFVIHGIELAIEQQRKANQEAWDQVNQRAVNQPERNSPRAIRNDLLNEAAQKPVRKVYQMDGHPDVPCDNAAEPDGDGDLITWGITHELRKTDIPVRIQVLAGADTGMVLRILKKMVNRFHQMRGGQ